jgi:hypothetical protein
MILLLFGDGNPGIRIFPLPLPFFPLLPFSPSFPLLFLPSPPIFGDSRVSRRVESSQSSVSRLAVASGILA